MKSLLMLGVLLLVLSHCESDEQEKTSNKEESAGGYLKRLSGLFYNKLKERLTNVDVDDHSMQPQARFKRQHVHLEQNVARFNCTQQEDCIPPYYDYPAIPYSIIDCVDGVCNCSDCFVRRNDMCVLRLCHSYDDVDGYGDWECIDERKSQKTAVLLSVFLSGTGAANFYVRQYVLAGVQLGLMMLGIILLCCMLCIPCWGFVCCEDDIDDVIDSCCFLGFAVCSVFLTILLIMVMSVWWLTDLTYFVQNARVDGVNNCPLRVDL